MAIAEKLTDPQKKEHNSLFAPLEKTFKDWIVPKIAPYTETYYLTALTLVWSGLIIFFSFLANKNALWLLVPSAAIFMQWTTDMLDGAVGRFKDTGLVKWGYYADHFLDYVFLGSILLGYQLLLAGAPGYNPVYFGILYLIIIGFMVNSYLYSGIAKEFKISFLGIGPSEGRVSIILLNIAIIFFGKKIMIVAAPYATILAGITLAILFFISQRKLWQLDMHLKSKLKNKSFSQRNKEQLWK